MSPIGDTWVPCMGGGALREGVQGLFMGPCQGPPGALWGPCVGFVRTLYGAVQERAQQ